MKIKQQESDFLFLLRILKTKSSKREANERTHNENQEEHSIPPSHQYDHKDYQTSANQRVTNSKNLAKKMQETRRIKKTLEHRNITFTKESRTLFEKQERERKERQLLGYKRSKFNIGLSTTSTKIKICSRAIGQTKSSQERPRT